MMKVLPEFTKQTSIEVDIDQLQSLKMRERQTLERTKDDGAYDMIAYAVFLKAKYLMNPKLSDPSYDSDDLVAGYVANIGVAIPKNAENKEAAFLMMQGVASEQGNLMTAMNGGNPSRFSTYETVDLSEKYPYSATFDDALKYADPDWHPIVLT